VLIPLELDPGNVILMVILDQNTPATPVALHAVARRSGWEGALPRLECSWKLNHCLI
jgi:hypothetical protein